jgi:hypothetical protein
MKIDFIGVPDIWTLLYRYDYFCTVDSVGFVSNVLVDGISIVEISERDFPILDPLVLLA